MSTTRRITIIGAIIGFVLAATFALMDFGLSTGDFFTSIVVVGTAGGLMTALFLGSFVHWMAKWQSDGFSSVRYRTIGVAIGAILGVMAIVANPPRSDATLISLVPGYIVALLLLAFLGLGGGAILDRFFRVAAEQKLSGTKPLGRGSLGLLTIGFIILMTGMLLLANGESYKPSAEIYQAAKSVCQGQTITSAVAYAGEPIHPIVILSAAESNGDWSPAAAPFSTWYPRTLDGVELVGCVGPEEESLTPCNYNVGPQIIKHSYTKEVTIIEAKTGAVILNSRAGGVRVTSNQAELPFSCPEVAPIGQTDIYTPRVTQQAVDDLLRGYVVKDFDENPGQQHTRLLPIDVSPTTFAGLALLWFDAVALLVFCGVWMFRDARQRGKPAWVWLILGLLTGPFGALIYYVFRRRTT